MKRKPIIGVMGPGKEASGEVIKSATQLGELIASENWITLSGGIASGVMEAVTKGAKNNSGLTVGILPRTESEIADGIDVPIITNMSSARNNINALSCDVMVAVGIDTGTTTEIAFALSSLANKPVILLNCTELGVSFFKSLREELVHTAKNPKEAINITRQLLNK
tara:strand:+ start:691 stop:1188 length:498 start_codon:yes stop_codon:yes gene_type:complete